MFVKILGILIHVIRMFQKHPCDTRIKLLKVGVVFLMKDFEQILSKMSLIYKLNKT